MNCSNGVKVHVFIDSDGWSTRVLVVLDIVGGTVTVPAVKTGCGLAFVLFVAVLTGFVKCGKCMRLCVM